MRSHAVPPVEHTGTWYLIRGTSKYNFFRGVLVQLARQQHNSGASHTNYYYLTALCNILLQQCILRQDTEDRLTMRSQLSGSHRTERTVIISHRHPPRANKPSQKAYLQERTAVEAAKALIL